MGLYIDIAICCSTMHDNKPHVAYGCTTTFLPMMNRLIRTKWASLSHNLRDAAVHSIYLHVVGVFPISVDDIDTCMLILKLIRSTTVLLDKLSENARAGTLERVCCLAEKTNIN